MYVYAKKPAAPLHLFAQVICDILILIHTVSAYGIRRQIYAVYKIALLSFCTVIAVALFFVAFVVV